MLIYQNVMNQSIPAKALMIFNFRNNSFMSNILWRHKFLIKIGVLPLADGFITATSSRIT